MAIASSIVGPASASTVEAIDLAWASAERASLGLRADVGYVRAIVEGGLDEGSLRWGIVLTREELEFVDLPGRMEFANAVAADVLPKLSDLPMFAGAYLDQKAEGRLVVLLTELDPATMADIEATLPLGAPGSSSSPGRPPNANSSRHRAPPGRCGTPMDLASCLPA